MRGEDTEGWVSWNGIEKELGMRKRGSTSDRDVGAKIGWIGEDEITRVT